MTIPADIVLPTSDGRRSALIIERTDPDDTLIHMWISDVAEDGGVDDGVSVSFDVPAIAKLVTESLRLLTLIGGREAAIQAITAAERGEEPR